MFPETWYILITTYETAFLFGKKKKKEEDRIFTSLNYHQECQLYSREDY